MITADQVNKFQDQIDKLLPENDDDRINMMVLALASIAFSQNQSVEEMQGMIADAMNIIKDDDLHGE